MVKYRVLAAPFYLKPLEFIHGMGSINLIWASVI